MKYLWQRAERDGHLPQYTTHTSMKMDPNGRTPPNITIAHGSMNLAQRGRITSVNNYEHGTDHWEYHFFSGIGLGTVLTLQGLSGVPEMLRPRMVPTRLRGRMTNRQIPATAICRNTANHEAR